LGLKFLNSIREKNKTKQKKCELSGLSQEYKRTKHLRLLTFSLSLSLWDKTIKEIEIEKSRMLFQIQKDYSNFWSGIGGGEDFITNYILFAF